MMSAAPRRIIRSCSSTGRNSRRLKAPALYHTDSGGARQRAVGDVFEPYNVRVMAVATDRSPGPPKPPLWRRRWFRRVLIGLGGLTVLGLLVVGVAALWAFTILPRSLPSVTALETLQPIQGTKIYDDNDEPITELHVERRILVPLTQIPQSLRDAILATEDRRFYSHWGIDPIGVARAVIQNYRRGRIVEGGSTITQQLTKVLFLTPDKSVERKLKEAVLALELERRYSKDRILEMYLNQVYFGAGSYGVEAAARTYFGKGVSELTVRESALIAGLPRAPTNYSPFDRPEPAKRRPGSAFKPFIYIAALEAGFTPASQIEDSPVSFAVGGKNGQVWKPENYDRKFRGSTTLQQAIEESVNVVTVKLQERIALAKTIQVARRLGITSPLDVNLSLALGTSDVSLLEMTSAYGTVANQGVWMPPVTIRYVTDAQGKLLEEHVPEGREALAPETAYVITQMLRGVVERGTGQAAKGLGRPVAAKTGTTNDYSNAWFVGFTPRLATGVWVGYDRPRSPGKDETGSRVAVPIWVTYMAKILVDS